MIFEHQRNFYKISKRKTSTQARVVKEFPLGGYNDCEIQSNCRVPCFTKGPTYLSLPPMDRWPSIARNVNNNLLKDFLWLYMCHGFFLIKCVTFKVCLFLLTRVRKHEKISLYIYIIIFFCGVYIQLTNVFN